jgi:hypothetical protein
MVREATSKPAPFANGAKGRGTRKIFLVPPQMEGCATRLFEIRLENIPLLKSQKCSVDRVTPDIPLYSHTMELTYCSS